MTKYHPSKDIPNFARELKTLSPSKIRDYVLMKRNKEVTSESVTMWFKRHPQIYDQLSKELVEGLPSEKQEVDTSIFQRRNFEELSSVKQWILEMKARDLTEGYIDSEIGLVRLVCMGKIPHYKIDLVEEGKWCFKHPDRLSLKEAMEFIALLKDKKLDAYPYKRALKDFLTSKGVVIGKKIAVGKSRSYGKFSKLYVERPILNKMLAWVREGSLEGFYQSARPTEAEINVRKLHFEAYVADEFMFKTGTRVTATLKALIENISKEFHTVRVYDKGRHSIHPEGKEWEKNISAKLWNNIMKLIGDRKTGKIFANIDNNELSTLNREALKRFVPDLEKKIGMPNHFWRHMFFQHMLRTTDWNYAVCAALGGSTVASLEESYGKPPKAIVKKWGLKFMPTLEREETETASILPMKETALDCGIEI